MGDRGNIVIRYGPNQHIFFYTHWRGSGMGADVHRALAKRDRWDDDAYLARMIFDELGGVNGKGKDGIGIALEPCDNEHDFLIVDVPGRRVIRAKGESLTAENESWTFEEFVTNAPIGDW